MSLSVQTWNTGVLLLEIRDRGFFSRYVQNENMQFDSAEIGTSMSEIVAYGTAVVIEPEG